MKLPFPHCLAAVAALFLLTGVCRAQEAAPAAPVVAATAAASVAPHGAERREEIFERVWSRVNERYFDPTFGGVDWNLMRRRYLPKTTQAKTDAEFYALLNQMLGELKQSHFGVVPPGTPDAMPEKSEKRNAATPEKGEGTAGFTVQLVEGKLTIARVSSGGAAAAAQLQPGVVLTSLDGKSAEDFLTGLRARAREPRALPTYVRLIFDSLLAGPINSETTIGYLDADGAAQTVALKRRKAPGALTTFGALPPLTVENEKRRLPGNLGYIRFNIFLMPILEPFRAALRELKDTKGMILDLRGNPGGIGALASGVAAPFVSKETNLGVMKMRQGDIRFPVYPTATPYTKPLVILTDEGTASTSEILAASLQESGRAVIVGAETAGMALPSQVENLPGGGKLQYAFADFRTQKGKLIEGLGVRPNIPVTLTRRDLLTGRDPILEAAIAALQKSSPRNKPAAALQGTIKQP